jgi:hypothetical protein
MELLLFALALVWIILAIVASAVMTARGYDRTSWFVIGVLFGPVVWAFVAMERVWPLARAAEQLARGEVGPGEQSFLVVVDAGGRVPVHDVLGAFAIGARRLALARVLPFDGAEMDERAAAEQLIELAHGLRLRPELVLLFGNPRTAISRYASAGGFDVVISDHDVPGLAEALAVSRAGLLPSTAIRGEGPLDPHRHSSKTLVP